MLREHEWADYYTAFGDYFSAAQVRDGCQPRVMEHSERVDDAVVLVHGLTDSPYFLSAIAEYFFHELGYNVYLPLLQGHGLRQPNAMENVDLKQWKRNVSFAVDAAKARRISVGGLSTGGTLSFFMASQNAAVTGDLFLFSAALDLAGGQTGLLGELRERLARSFLIDILDRFDDDLPMIGPNPYRYARMDKGGARELAKLIAETDEILRTHDANKPFPKRVFAAHSRCDTTASIAGVERLQERSVANRFSPFFMNTELGVSHASVVLKTPIRHPTNGEILEPANPSFAQMMDAIGAFATASD